VGIRDFATKREPLSKPLLGSRKEFDVVIAANANVMFYGVGGGGKTTLNLDLVAPPRRRHRLARHRRAAADPAGLHRGSEGDRARVPPQARAESSTAGTARTSATTSAWLDEPWGAFTLEDVGHVDQLADYIRAETIDIVWMGPGAEIGMTGAGSPADVQGLRRTRPRAPHTLRPADRHRDRPITRTRPATSPEPGTGWGDTLIRVELSDNQTTTDLYFHKARHSSQRHRTKMVLAWADNEGYTLVATDKQRPPAKALARGDRDLDPRRVWRPRPLPSRSATTFGIADGTLRAPPRRASPPTASTTSSRAARASTSTATSTPAIAPPPQNELRPRTPHPAVKCGATILRGKPVNTCGNPTPQTPQPPQSNPLRGTEIALSREKTMPRTPHSL